MVSQCKGESREAYLARSREASLKYYWENREQRRAYACEYYLANSEQERARGRRYYQENREQAKARSRAYYAENPERCRGAVRKSRLKHLERYLEKEREHNHKYYQENRGQVKANSRKYYADNREERKAYNRQYYAENPDRHTKKRDKRNRDLGYNPYNARFGGSEGHHLDNENVLFIPRELHRSVYHNVFTGQGMDEINALALAHWAGSEST